MREEEDEAMGKWKHMWFGMRPEREGEREKYEDVS